MTTLDIRLRHHHGSSHRCQLRLLIFYKQNNFSLIYKPASLRDIMVAHTNVREYFRRQHSTEVDFVLLTQPFWVRFLLPLVKANPPKILSSMTWPSLKCHSFFYHRLKKGIFLSQTVLCKQALQFLLDKRFCVRIILLYFWLSGRSPRDNIFLVKLF